MLCSVRLFVAVCTSTETVSVESDCQILQKSKSCWDFSQMVKNPPTMWETWVWFLGWEDPLEKEMATHSRILALRIPWTEELSGLHSIRLQKSQTRLTKQQSNAYMWSLEKWFRWTYFQGEKRDTDMWTLAEGEGGTNWDSNIAMYTRPCVK